ncbi:L-alanine exporter AlaE [Agrobacterium sp. MS2]|uniref:L-alanine exporter AlaE n=1 Tax=Agrobacterium TaxID=357 RepID=UPI003365543D
MAGFSHLPSPCPALMALLSFQAPLYTAIISSSGATGSRLIRGVIGAAAISYAASSVFRQAARSRNRRPASAKLVCVPLFATQLCIKAAYRFTS